MNERTIDAALAAGAGLFGALLFAAAVLRLFAPVASIVVAAPMSRPLAAALQPQSPARTSPGQSRLRGLDAASRPRRSAIVQFNPRRIPHLHRRVAVVLTRPRAVTIPPHSTATPPLLVTSAMPERPPSLSMGRLPHVPAEHARPLSRPTDGVAGLHRRMPSRKGVRALPEPPIGYDPQPILAGADAQLPDLTEAPEAFPTLNPRRRRR